MRSRFQSVLFASLVAAVAFSSVARAERPSGGDESAPKKPEGSGKPKTDGASKPKPDGAAKPSAGGAPKGDGARPGGRPDVEPEMGPEAELTRATAYYEAGQYAPCADAFAGLLDDPDKVRALSPRSRDQAQVYDAACLIAIGKTEAANERFRAAIRENPQMAVPSAVIFPPAVIERFVVVRSELMEEIRRSEQERVMRERSVAEEARRRAEDERRRVAMLEQLASEETLIAKNSRWIASVPFGVGQFQNRDYALGTIFLVSETLLAATAVTATALELRYLTESNGGANFTTRTDVDVANRGIQATQIISLGATAGLVLVAIGGIVEAHLGFVPEFRDGTRPRKIPQLKRSASRSLSVQPTVAPERGTVGLSLFGRF